MIKYISAIMLISLSIVTLPSHAEWIEATGRATVVDGNAEAARLDAIEDALKQAMMFAGASYANTQKIAKGLLIDEQTTIKSGGSVQSLRLVSETFVGDMLTVTIKADIFADKRQCRAAKHKQPVVITQTVIKHHEQANIGGLYDLGKKYSQQLQRALTQAAPHVEVREFFAQPMKFDPEQVLLSSNHMQDTIRAIAAKADSQYVVMSVIHDMAVTGPQPKNWKLWATGPNRFFIVEIFVLDGVTADILHRQSYKSEGAWPRDHRLKMDLNSQEFWMSSYGKAVVQHIPTVVADIDSALMCRELHGRIVAVNSTQVQFNLGRRNGIRIGDRVKLHYFNEYHDAINIKRQTAEQHQGQFTVLAVSEDSAIAGSEDPTALRNIQIHDMVTITD